MVGVPMCAKCRHGRQKCTRINQAPGNRPWSENGEKEKCARCTKYGHDCGPDVNANQQYRSRAASGSQRTRAGTSSGQQNQQPPSAIRRRSSGTSAEYANDKDELNNRLNRVDTRLEASKKLEEKIHMVIDYPGYDEATNEEYRASLRTAKDANDSETLKTLRLSKPLADTIEDAGELYEADSAYMRMLATYRSMGVNRSYEVRGILVQLAKIAWKMGADQRGQNFAFEALDCREIPPRAHGSDLELLKELVRSLTRTCNAIPHVVQSVVVGQTPPDFNSSWPPLQQLMDSDYAQKVTGNLFWSGEFLDATHPPPDISQSPIVGGIDAIVDLVREVTQADLGKHCPNGHSPLYKAASLRKEGVGYAIMIRAKEIARPPGLLKRITNAKDFSGQTVLGIAIWNDCSLPFITKLIENGAEVNPETVGTAWTPLQIASCRGLLNIVELLLDNGAQVGHTFPGTKTAMELALEQNHLHVVQRLGGASPAFSTPGSHRELGFPP